MSAPAGASALVGYGFTKLIQGNKRRNAMAREKREARMNIQGFLQADTDAEHVRWKRILERSECGLHALVATYSAAGHPDRSSVFQYIKSVHAGTAVAGGQ